MNTRSQMRLPIIDPLDGIRLFVPNDIEICKDKETGRSYLCWYWIGVKNQNKSPNINDCLNQFVRLVDNPSDESVIDFALQWGILGLCWCGNPLSHAHCPLRSKKTPVDLSKERVRFSEVSENGFYSDAIKHGFANTHRQRDRYDGIEGIDSWINYSKQFRSALNWAADLQKGYLGKEDDLKSMTGVIQLRGPIIRPVPRVSPMLINTYSKVLDFSSEWRNRWYDRYPTIAKMKHRDSTKEEWINDWFEVEGKSKIEKLGQLEQVRYERLLDSIKDETELRSYYYWGLLNKERRQLMECVSGWAGPDFANINLLATWSDSTPRLGVTLDFEPIASDNPDLIRLNEDALEYGAHTLFGVLVLLLIAGIMNGVYWCSECCKSFILSSDRDGHSVRKDRGCVCSKECAEERDRRTRRESNKRARVKKKQQSQSNGIL
jgi:hypothetical protein